MPCIHMFNLVDVILSASVVYTSRFERARHSKTTSERSIGWHYIRLYVFPSFSFVVALYHLRAFRTFIFEIRFIDIVPIPTRFDLPIRPRAIPTVDCDSLDMPHNISGRLIA